MTDKDLANFDKQTLIEMVLSGYASVNALRDTVENLNKTVAVLTEEVANLRMHRFGRSSEKGLTDQTDGQLSFAFNEPEATLDSAPELKEPELEEITYKRHKQKGKREADLAALPTTVVSHEFSEEQLYKVFPDGRWKRLPDEVYKRLAFHPATFEVIEHHVAVYAGYDNQTMIRGNRPVDLFRNSIATPSLVAGF